MSLKYSESIIPFRLDRPNATAKSFRKGLCGVGRHGKQKRPVTFSPNNHAGVAEGAAADGEFVSEVDDAFCGPG